MSTLKDDKEVEVTLNGASNKRARAKKACEPCRLRKRKCDGMLPCNMCTQFEYTCHFEKHSRKRSKLVAQSEPSAHALNPIEAQGGLLEELSGAEDACNIRHMEANSGIAFTRLLGLRLDPSSGPKLFTFGWNLGDEAASIGPSLVPELPPLTALFTHDQFSSLARLYFDNVHSLYGFLDKDWILDQAKARWSGSEPCKVPDHLFAGVAAVASLFSDGSLSSVLQRLTEIHKLSLDNGSLMLPPTLQDVQSWTLRCLYLRGAGHPHATHMASVNALHLAEAIGLHQEYRSPTLHSSNTAGSHSAEDPETRRRVFWIIRMFNTWVSFEYGRTRVSLPRITTKLPTPREGDYTTDYIELYSISCCLDPDVLDQAGQWENFLRRLQAYKPRHDGIGLSKANLAMCGYRRLRLANPVLSPQVADLVISMGLEGLRVAHRMADQGFAWWHVANVPFSTVCVFLAMDLRESLAHVGTAIRTLEFVVERFGTATMKEALKTARFLVRLSKKRKDEDSDVLGSSLVRNVVGVVDEGDPQPENLRPPRPPQPPQQQQHPMGKLIDGDPFAAATPLTGLGSEDWSLDALGDPHFDWNSFLTNEMSAFTDIAPDGTM